MNEENKLPLSKLVKVRDERRNGLGNSCYYYYNPETIRGYLIEYSNFDDTQTEVDLSEVFKSDYDITNCFEGMKGRIIYYKNRFDCGDYKKSEEKKIKKSIEVLESQKELFNSNYEAFIRKIKIFKILE
jgi:hypothetical protein